MLPIEVVDSDTNPLIAAGLLAPERVAAPEALQEALEAVIEGWMDTHTGDA